MSGARDSVAVVVLGMHRSGTSLVTEMLSRFGYHAGDGLLPGNEFNPRGYWELRRVAEIHNEFFRRLGRTWADPRPLPPTVFGSPHATWAQNQLRLVVEDEFGGATRWVVKDPRLCLLMPLWTPLLDESAGRIHVLHVVRNPVSVASSLERRDAMRSELGLQLWLRHNLAGELSSRRFDRSWVAFEDILEGREEFLLAHLERHGLAVGDGLTPGETNGGVVRADLVHHRQRGALSVREEMPNPWIRCVADALRALVAGKTEEPLTVLDRMREALGAADSLLIGDPEGWRQQRRDENIRLIFEELHELRVSLQGDVAIHEATASRIAGLESALSARLDTAVESLHSRQSRFEDAVFNDLTVEMARCHKLIESLEAELAGTQRQLAGANDINEATSAVVSRQQRQLDSLERSVSWRVTAPLRAVAGLIQSIVGRAAGRR